MTDRLFFAFWPDEGLRRELAGRAGDWIGDYPCRPQRPDQWHLTVEFLGGVEVPRERALHEAARALEGSLADPPVIVLDRLEHWRKPQVLCVAASSVPGPVASLVAALKAGLAARGFEPDRREFRPHLTLARRARQPAAMRAVEPFRWPVRTLSLVRSISDPAGSRYEPFACWNVVQAPSPRPSPAESGRGG